MLCSSSQAEGSAPHFVIVKANLNERTKYGKRDCVSGHTGLIAWPTKTEVDNGTGTLKWTGMGPSES